MHENDGALDMSGCRVRRLRNVSYGRGRVHDLSTFVTRLEIDNNESCGTTWTPVNAIAEVTLQK